MSQEAIQDLLISLSSISLLTTLSGCVFANQILDKECFLLQKDLPLGFRLGFHAIGGVCGFGVITGVILCVFIAIQLSLIITFKDVKQYKKQRKILAIITAIILSLYCVIQFLLNSSFNYFTRGLGFKLGLWEFMIPTYLLQGTLLYLLFTEPEPNE